jgi:hypothetical protein
MLAHAIQKRRSFNGSEFHFGIRLEEVCAAYF